MMGIRCTCGKGCPTFGACLRGKRITIGDPVTREAVKRWDGNLDSYEKARRNGMQPASTRQRDIDAAWSISDKIGEAYRA